MEFPHLGEHCQEPTCKILDFLPFRCDCCAKVFCKDHVVYEKHSCAKIHLKKTKDFQVPLCPLCNQPVPYKRNELPDITMSAHIDRDCKSDPAEERRRKIFSNKCSLKGCKQKELIPFECDKCKKNYCIRHRSELDHECSPPVLPSSNNSNREINNRRWDFFQRSQQNQQQQQQLKQQVKKPTSTTTTTANRNVSTYQSNNSMSESDALQYALSLSLMEQQRQQNNRVNSTQANASASAGLRASGPSNSNETEEEIMARVLAESEREYQQQQQRRQQQQQTSSDDSKCLIC